MSQPALPANILESRKLKLTEGIQTPVTTLQAFSHGTGRLQASC